MNIQKYKKRAKNQVSESTLNSRVSALRNFRDHTDMDGEPTVEDVEGWMDHLIDLHDEGKIKSGTIRQYFKAVRYYFRTIHGDDEQLDHIHEWMPKMDTDHGDYLDREEWQLLRNNTWAARETAIIETMYFYARRPGEVRFLNMDDIDLDEGTITFSILKKEEALRATFELRDEVRDVIEAYLPYRAQKKVEAEQDWEEGTVEPLFTTKHGRISYDTIWRNIKKIAERAGIDKNITPKSMRHSRATHLDWDGHSPDEIARHQLVHEPDTDVIGAYIHDREETQVRDVMVTSDEEGDD